jgi:hypothetical protein
MLQTSPQIEIETDILANVLAEVASGETVTYARLSLAIGRDVSKSNARLALMKARKRVEKNTGALFATVRGEGVQRLTAENVPGIGAQTRRSIKRRAKSAYERLTAQKYNNVTDETRRRIDAERSLLGAIASMASDGAAHKVSVGTQTGPMSITQVMEAIK